MAPRSRRQFLRDGAAIGCVSLAGCSFWGTTGDCSEGRTLHETDVSLSETTSWPTSHYDSANTGHNPDAVGPKEDAEIAWRHSVCGEAASGVVIGDGHAYAGGLVVNGQSGKAVGGQWGGGSTPTIANETLYVTTPYLEARDPTTGENLWTFQTDEKKGTGVSPTATSETVYVPGGSFDSMLYAVDADRGTERWRVGTERWRVNSISNIELPVAVRGETVYAIDDSNALYALNAVTGEERWRKSYDTDIRASAPVVANDHIYLGSQDGGVRAVQTTDGTTVWKRNTQPIAGTVAATEDTIFATWGGITAFNADDGEKKWTASTEGYTGSPAVADNVVYVGAAAEHDDIGYGVVALDSTTGEKYWRIDTRQVEFGDYTRSGITQGPAVVDGLVYVATTPGDLYAIR